MFNLNNNTLIKLQDNHEYNQYQQTIKSGKFSLKFEIYGNLSVNFKFRQRFCFVTDLSEPDKF